jgi:lipopolysaccharide biosynthesis regulator YciM
MSYRDPREIDPDEVSNWEELSPPEKNHYARKLERRSTEAQIDDDSNRASSLLDEAKAVYRSLVEDNFEGTFPYKRLCIIYRREDNRESEVEVAKAALSPHVDKTEKQTEWFENRIDRQ